MRFIDIKNSLKHITETTLCPHCKGHYKLDDVNVMATTKLEGLFEMHCEKCHISSIMTVALSVKNEQNKAQITKIESTGHNSVSNNDILDVKNFLNNFDGDFKKIFTSET